MLVDCQINEYLIETKKLAKDPEAVQQILDSIKEQLNNLGENEENYPFFKGEYAFYSGQYEQSLKWYLQAKATPHYEFYCFRSSAFAANEIGDEAKALSYGEKAAKIDCEDPFLQKLIKDLSQPKEHLFKLDPPPPPPMREPTPLPESIPESSLDEKIREHTTRHEQDLEEYIAKGKQREVLDNDTLTVIGGWKDSFAASENEKDPYTKTVSRLLQRATHSAAASGIYIRWNQKGYVLNPGEGFLEKFHRQGFHVTDIDYVIATRTDPETYTDIKRIYQLNYQVNKASDQLHLIHYYLNQACHQDLSTTLKAHFKQERDAIRMLEIFIDSPEVETIELNPDARLHFFPVHQTEERRYSTLPSTTPSLGIRLDFISDDTPLVQGSDHTVKVAYLSQTAWSPLLAEHVENCDVLIAGFGHTSTQDYNKVNYNDQCLGYYGTCSLLKDLNPKVLLVEEFDGIEGDIRLDIIKKLRQEKFIRSSLLEHPAATLPADTGLALNLKELRIRCSLTNEWLDPTLVQVVKTADTFGTLRYLSPENCL